MLHYIKDLVLTIVSIIVILFLIFFTGTFLPEKYAMTFEEWAIPIAILIAIVLTVRKKMRSHEYNLNIVRALLGMLGGIALFTALIIGTIFAILDYIPKSMQPLASVVAIILLLGSMIAIIIRISVKTKKHDEQVEQEFKDGKITYDKYAEVENDKTKVLNIIGKWVLIVTIFRFIIKLLTN